jgi:hypothetical protein
MLPLDYIEELEAGVSPAEEDTLSRPRGLV